MRAAGRRVLVAAAAALALAPATAALLDPPLAPTPVYVAFAFNSLEKLDAVESSFNSDFYLVATWRDDRLADVAAGPVGLFDPALHFWPQLEFTNMRTAAVAPWSYAFAYPSWLPLRVPGANVSGGATWVTAQTRAIGSFAATIRLRDYPQDVQVAAVAVESFAFNASAVALVAPPPTAAGGSAGGVLPPGFAVNGWRVLGAGLRVSPSAYASFDEVYDRVTLSIRLRRNGDYYLVRVVSSISFLVVSACLAAVLRVHSPDRMSVLLAIFASLIGWEFVISLETPTSGELTRLDSVMLLSFTIVFALVVSFSALHFYDENRVRTAYAATLRALSTKGGSAGTATMAVTRWTTPAVTPARTATRPSAAARWRCGTSPPRCGTCTEAAAAAARCTTTRCVRQQRQQPQEAGGGSARATRTTAAGAARRTVRPPRAVRVPAARRCCWRAPSRSQPTTMTAGTK